MNERLIQNLLFRDRDHRRHRFITPNTTVFGWESDMISVTNAGLIIEYEIKISRSDFRADLKKVRHRVLSLAARESGYAASYLYYVVPSGLVAVGEVPAHAGLMYVNPSLQFVRLIKSAPRLHSTKITERQRQWLERSLIHRYWRERLRRDSLV